MFQLLQFVTLAYSQCVRVTIDANHTQNLNQIRRSMNTLMMEFDEILT